jgi:hypothetical protein
MTPSIGTLLNEIYLTLRGLAPENSAQVPISYGMERGEDGHFRWACYVQVTTDWTEFDVFADSPVDKPEAALRNALTRLRREFTMLGITGANA